MPQYTNPENEELRARLARLRKAAGFYQTRLAEALLGRETPKQKTRSQSLSPRLERRQKQIESLSRKPKLLLHSIIDSFIAAEQNRGSRS